MKQNNILAIVLVVVLLGGAYYLFNQQTSDQAMQESDAMMEQSDEVAMSGEDVMEDAMMKDVDETIMMEMKDMEYDYVGMLDDVTGGEASGTARAAYSDDDGYMLYATFENLPELDEGFFYEGWVVRRGDNMSVISSGALKMVDGEYVNTYASADDLTDHTFYVLTLEPDDGDPAPAEHILEGVMEMTAQ